MRGSAKKHCSQEKLLSIAGMVVSFRLDGHSEKLLSREKLFSKHRR